ncbi:hypothetical protein, partial [Parabacteroides merdae]|uniref:hypothetical protein n=1 Tax=Parabacteroides merdae TaxID=46503 RepID=UPI001E4DB6D6
MYEKPPFYHKPFKPSPKEGVSKFSPSFLCPKPRLSQAGALLLPEDFVSLGIRIYTMAKIHFRPYNPN